MFFLLSKTLNGPNMLTVAIFAILQKKHFVQHKILNKIAFLSYFYLYFLFPLFLKRRQLNFLH